MERIESTRGILVYQLHSSVRERHASTVLKEKTLETQETWNHERKVLHVNITFPKDKRLTSFPLTAAD